jgi:hypothetical protein
VRDWLTPASSKPSLAPSCEAKMPLAADSALAAAVIWSASSLLALLRLRPSTLETLQRTKTSRSHLPRCACSPHSSHPPHRGSAHGLALGRLQHLVGDLVETHRHQHPEIRIGRPLFAVISGDEAVFDQLSLAEMLYWIIP